MEKEEGGEEEEGKEEEEVGLGPVQGWRERRGRVSAGRNVIGYYSLLLDAVAPLPPSLPPCLPNLTLVASVQASTCPALTTRSSPSGRSTRMMEPKAERASFPVRGGREGGREGGRVNVRYVGYGGCRKDDGATGEE